MGGIVVQADKGLIVSGEGDGLKPWIYKPLGGLRHLRAFSAVAIPGNRLAVFVLEPPSRGNALHPGLPGSHPVERFEAIRCRARGRRQLLAEGIQELVAQVRRRLRSGVQQLVGSFIRIRRGMLMNALDGNARRIRSHGSGQGLAEQQI